MCGIAGKLHWGPVREDTFVQEMCDRMIHRGPDAGSIVNLNNISLGHRRLSIIDLSSKANQPMASKDGRYHIVYNGEVYNFKIIRKELDKIGYTFNSSSDSEVVMYAFVEWGEKCLQMFNGMYAFAIWDSKINQLFLARDRFGKKPLYYHFDKNKSFSFASELSALIADDTISRNISYEALNSYLAIGYILSPMTLYNDVYKLESASYLIISNNGKRVSKVRYWNYADSFRNKTNANEREISNRLISHLREAVNRRLISDVPVGSFLSGGIDSSSIVSIMKESLNDDLHTFSVGFNQGSYDEIPDASRVAKWFGTIHHNRYCDLSDNLDLLDSAINGFDEPFSDNSLIPTYDLCKLASDYVTVALSGDGADELFAGYVTYKADKYHSYFKIVPNLIKKILFKIGSQSSGQKNKLNWGYKSRQFFYGSLHQPEQAHYLWRVFFHPEDRVNILGESHRELIYDTDPFNIFKKYYCEVKDLNILDRNLYVDGMTWLTDDILVKVDRASMQHSLEVRSPYLDIDLVNYAGSIPSGLKMKGFNTKYILKKALKGVVPEFVLSKKKSGFNAPVGAWLKSDELDEFRTFNKYVFNKKVIL